MSDIDELDDFASKFASSLKKADTILLDGELGSGKTEFVRHVALHLGVEDDITSPTFCFLNSYETNSGFKLHHFDVYRLDCEDELSEVGFDECGYHPDDGIAFIEWASKFPSSMPEDALKLCFSGHGNETRIINATSTGSRSQELLQKVCEK